MHSRRSIPSPERRSRSLASCTGLWAASPTIASHVKPACCAFACLGNVVLGVLLLGCASTGPPRPPSLHLPQAVRDLAAQRSGTHVDLGFTVPTLSTDRQPLAGRHGAGALTAELCRSDASAPACTPIRALPVVPGEVVHARDDLPAALLQGAARPLRYSVRVLNAQGHMSAPSREAVSAAGSAPAALHGLAGTTVARGVQLSWVPAPASAETRIDILAAIDGKERTLSVPGDAGGAVDPAPRVGETVTYTVKRSSMMPGSPPATLEGDAATVALRRAPDTFAPAAPTGVVAIAVQMEQSPPEIDLSWNPNGEPDLAGYLVERTDVTPGARPVLLTPAPIPAVSFRDTGVLPGHAYRYAVRAQDAAGNRSSGSAPVVETLRP